ncbi:hypothetical protein [Methylobacterium aquaticum]|uniref:hypothetical protein n=1 Tax=Methylobacterium aquaticum TaxID=270351 RepID=UPI0019342EAD|nr:hypothetical protein [Methylobacterium aquaticum]QRE74378.1 hypothetical protein F1D61_12875 [Methylobacterium aquaticum]
MTTATEALTIAAGRLDAAATAMLAIRDQVAAQLAQQTGATQTIVNNFLARPLNYAFYIDPATGADTNDGLSLDTPFKGLDYAVTQIPRDGVTTMLLLGDVTLSRYTTLYAPLVVFGIQRGNGALGAPYSAYARTLTFASEASNSPVAGFGRVVAGFNCASSYVRYQFVRAVMGDPIAGIDVKAHHNLIGTSLQMSVCTLDAPKNTSLCSFADIADGSQAQFLFASGSLGPNAPGRLVRGKAAGASGAGDYRLVTNLATL